MNDRNYSPVYRIMHWAIALCLLFMLLTIFLRTTWMSKDHMAEILLRAAPGADVPLSRDQAITLARQIRAPMWDWHIYIGYVLVGLYAIRMALPLFGAMAFSNPLAKELTSKEKFQYGLYLIFYACLAISLTTGLIIEFGPKEMKETMEEIHVLSIYYLLAFIGLHVGGVLLAEFTVQPGIVSRIVSGSRHVK